MGTNTGHVMTLANSIIGVSVLAMPFCFKQCGIVLASLMLIISSIMSRLACYYLIKSAILARRRNFEFLAFYTFGPTGKLTVELSIIGFMLGTCVAFFVVMGDLGPAILGPILSIDNPSSIRATVLIAIAVFVVFPLGLLRNVDSLAAISAVTIAFYICLVFKVMGEATGHLLAWDWLDNVYLWRPAGVLQCIPIFSMALSCQTQLFEIFDSVPNATIDKMNMIVRSAVNLCTLMYMAMGFFGYVAFCTQPFSGNLMLSFSPTATSEVIKMGFVLSVAVSFPLVIFPCRASLHSLLYRRGIPPHQELLSVNNHMPETRFKFITLVIVAVSLITGILIPNIELVLGLVGSTIGVLICIIIPATFFLCLTTKNNNERLLAQILFGMGLLIMILGSYANLYATEEVIAGNKPLQVKAPVKPPELPVLVPLSDDAKSKVKIKDETLKDIKNVEQLAAALPKLIKETPVPPVVKVDEKADVRKEPPIPEAPEVKVVSDNTAGVKFGTGKPAEVKVPEPKSVSIEPVKKQDHVLKADQPVLKNEEVINGDAIKKEDDEIKEVQKQEIMKKKEELIEKLEANEQKQQKLLEEQKKILQDIKLEKEKLAVENIQLKKKNVELPMKEPKEEKPNAYNEAIDKGGEMAPIVKSKVSNEKNIPANDEPKKLEKGLNENIVDIMKDDVVKKNIAEGIPLPIAIQNLAPHLEAVKSVNIVNNPSNDNEGNINSKVLRREILGENQLQEQREKRDLSEVFHVDFKDANNIIAETENGENKKTDHLNLDKNEKYKQNTEDANILQSEIDVISDKDRVLLDKDTLTEKTDSPTESKIVIEVIKEEQIKKEGGNEQCPDKLKSSKNKFSDELVPLNGNSVVENRLSQIKNEIKIVGANEKETLNKKEATTESIIKEYPHLSNPDLVLPENKLDPKILDENNALNNAAKPMKRDLKSVVITQQENSKGN